NNIAIINASTNAVTLKIPTVDQPIGAGISPDGKWLYVFTNGSNVLVINTVTNNIVSVIPTESKPTGVATSPDGSILYVTNGASSNLEVFNAATYALITKISTGTFPIGVVVNSDGSLIYVPNTISGDVSVIDAATNTLITNVPDGGNLLQSASISPDGKYLYVVNAKSNNVSVIDTKTYAVTALIDVGTGSNPTSYGNFFISPGSTCDGTPMQFNIPVAPTPPIAITATGILPPLNTTYGTPSQFASFTLSGISLAEGVLVTPPPWFEVSADNKNFSNTVTIGMSGTLAATTVYIRIAATTHVGRYSGNIKLSSAGAATVYEATSLSEVSDALLTITADNQTKTYHTNNPVLTVTYSGFVNGENSNQLTTLPITTTTATSTSVPGEYTITVKGAAAPDYAFNYIYGTLTILSPSPQSIVIPNTFTPNGDNINDVWNISELIYFPNCLVSIYTRYGGLVYQSKGYSQPWDGTSNGKTLPVGTYYYIINLQNGIRPLAGPITILR
ncbi:MAG: gliding motility-associated C-terminal domain-containing protein, partial [Mucilaginibacter sp.]